MSATCSGTTSHIVITGEVTVQALPGTAKGAGDWHVQVMRSVAKWLDEQRR